MLLALKIIKVIIGKGRQEGTANLLTLDKKTGSLYRLGKDWPKEARAVTHFYRGKLQGGTILVKVVAMSRQGVPMDYKFKKYSHKSATVRTDVKISDKVFEIIKVKIRHY